MAAVNAPMQISWSQVDAWETEKAELDRKIEAAKVLLPPRATGGIRPRLIQTPAANAPGDHSTAAADNFMGAVVDIANSVQAPISKAEMRLRLKAMGAPEEKLGKTLDVTLYKTKTAGRITFHKGLISGAPPK